MPIAEQFSGLKMDQLIGGPLTAAADASILLANSTAEFIERVGFDSEGNARTASFGYQKNTVNEDGTTSLDELKVAVPLLAIVPIPNLQIDEVNVIFDMEVKQSEKSQSNVDTSTTVNGRSGFCFVKVNITGNVSTHNENTRSTDNSAKYHVDVRATNHGMPEGLARVLDMMAANVAPALVNSTLKDRNGQNLPERARVRAERMKALDQEMSDIRNVKGNLQETLDKNISRLRSFAEKQLLIYQGQMERKIESLENSNESKPEDIEKAEQVKSSIEQEWFSFRDNIAEKIELYADQGTAAEFDKVNQLHSLNDRDEKQDYAAGQAHFDTLKLAWEKALENQAQLNGMEKNLIEKESEYSALRANTVKPEAAEDKK